MALAKWSGKLDVVRWPTTVTAKELTESRQKEKDSRQKE